MRPSHLYIWSSPSKERIKNNVFQSICFVVVDIFQEIPMVFPSNQRTKDNSIPNMVWSVVLSNVNPYTVIPALLFSKYVTVKKIKKTIRPGK